MCEDSMRARIEAIPLIFMIILDGEIPLTVASQPLVSLNKVLLNPISGGPGTLGAGRLTSHEFKQRNPRWEKKYGIQIALDRYSGIAIKWETIIYTMGPPNLHVQRFLW